MKMLTTTLRLIFLVILIFPVFLIRLTVLTGMADAGIFNPKIEDAVVTIYATNTSGEQQYQGTGFVVHEEGIIATNFHVVSQKYKDHNSPLLVMMRERAFYADILAHDIRNDIALLKIQGRNLKAIRLDETYRLKKGEEIIVIGSPSGEMTTVSHGNINNILGMNELIQITAPVSFGSSGSPVLNSKGEVIGIVTFIVEDKEKDTSSNFALPIRHVTRLLKITNIRKR